MTSPLATSESSFMTILEICGVMHFVSLFWFFNIVTPIFYIALLFSPLFFLALAYAGWFFYDYMTPFRGGRRWMWLRKAFYWRYMAKYFPVSLHKTAELDPSKNYILGLHPHGIFGLSHFVNMATEATGFSKTFPGITPYLLSLDINFRLPLFREYGILLGVCPVRKDSINYILTKCGPGSAVGIVVGGAAEAEMTNPDDPHNLVIKQRKGFVREALKTGASLVPLYSFGESELYYVNKPVKDSIMDRFQQISHRLFRFVPLMVSGAYGLLPFRKPVNIVVGAPIDLPKIEEPGIEEIEKWHEKYIEALQNLFDDHKGKYAKPGQDLYLH